MTTKTSSLALLLASVLPGASAALLPMVASADTSVGVTVHTFYVPSASFHWNWYKNSSTYWEFGQMRPTLAFYDQTQGTSVEENHYQQLQHAHVDYALLSWFGNINDATTDAQINKVLDAYWNIFTQKNNSTNGKPISLAVLMEFASQNYQTRIDYLKSSLYDKYPAYVLKYNGQPVLAFGFNANDPAESAVMQYARSKGFYPVNSDDAAGGGSAFTGITMKADDPHRITAIFGEVSPSIDISGKEESFEAENLTLGCGATVPDSGASNGQAVLSNGVNCDVVSTGSATA